MSRLGLSLACIAVVVALLLIRAELAPDARGEEAADGSVPPHAELLAATPEEAGVSSSSEFVAPDPHSERVASVVGPARGPLRGRLVEAQSGAPLLVERVVLLASPRNAVAETLHTRGDGSFVSERPFPRGLVRAWVSEPESRALLVRHEAEFDPQSRDEWLVPVPSAQASLPGVGVLRGAVALHGVVLDLDRRPVEGAQVKLFPLAAGGPSSSSSSTDGAGEFRLEELARGPHRLLVQGRFASSAPLDLVLEAGWNEAGEILLPAQAGAGAVRGRLVAAAGGEDPFAVLLLRDLASGKELAAASDWSLFSGDKDGAASFAFEAVPAGEYELTVVSIDGRVYEPAALRVSPPAEGLEFRPGPARPRYFALRVRDAATGGELDEFLALGRIHGQWCPVDLEGFPGGFERWVVLAEGYSPASGDFSRTRRTPAPDGEEWDLHEVDVALARGNGRVVLFKDIESDRLLAPEFEDMFGPAVEGVTVLADGERVGKSDEDGLAVLALPRVPGRLEFARPGWLVVGKRDVEGLLLVHMARE